jgi:diguanylate cyclase (GGDEF)-like protein
MLLLSAFPAVTLILAVSYQYWAVFDSGGYYRGYATFITAVAAFTSIIALALAAHVIFEKKSGEKSADAGPRAESTPADGESDERVAALRAKLAEQAKELELLSAMREVGLLITREVDLEKILGGVVEVVEGVFQSESITFYLPAAEQPATQAAAQNAPQAQKPQLIPRVHRQGGKTVFHAADSSGHAVPPLVEKAYRGGAPVHETAGATLECAVPLIADEKPLGVLRLIIQIDPSNGNAAKETEQELIKLVRHITLAVKAPTLYDHAVMDGLTRLYTKRHFVEEMGKHFAESSRTKKALSVIMIDVDFFKKINDAHGHITGDLVLAETAQVIKNQIRQYDTAYRYGGEEMTVILPEAALEQAAQVAKRIRRTVEEWEFYSDTGRPLKVTVSAGVSSWNGDMKEWSELVGAADAALYRAKHGGRNRVETAPADGGKLDGVRV